MYTKNDPQPKVEGVIKYCISHKHHTCQYPIVGLDKGNYGDSEGFKGFAERAVAA